MSESQPDSDMIDRITAALESGGKIAAIKIYRETTGKGLKESKEFIDALIPRLIEKDPQRFAKLAAGGGSCAGVLLAVAACGGVIAILFAQ